MSQSHRRGKFIGVGIKLKVRGPNSGAKFFCPPHTFPLPPLLFWALHFNFKWEIKHVIYWSTFLSCPSEYLLNICSKIWLRMTKEYRCMLGIQEMTVFSFFTYLRNKSVWTLSRNLQISPRFFAKTKRRPPLACYWLRPWFWCRIYLHH